MNLKDKLDKEEIIIISAVFICFLLFSFFVKASGINTYFISNFQNHVVRFFIFGSFDMTLEASLFTFLSSFVSLFVALIFLACGFAFLSSYGFLHKNRRVGLIASLISAFFVMFNFNFSLVSLFMSIGIVVSCVVIIPLANTYGKELKRWIFFRSGSHSISAALLIFNLLLGLGIFLAVSIDSEQYSMAVRDELSSTMEDIALAELSGFGDVSLLGEDVLRDQIRQRTDAFLSNSMLLTAFTKFLPVIVAFTVWAFLEFLRMLVLPNIGGLVTSAIIRIRRRR